MRKRYLLLVLAMAVGIVLLAVERYGSDLALTNTNSSASEPDYYGEGLRFRQYDQTGELTQTLVAEASRHLPDRGVSEFTSPQIWRHADQQDPWQVSARHGEIEDGNDRIRLQGDVRLNSESEGQLQIATESLQYDPRQGIARTDDAVVIRNLNSETRATGLTIDIERQRLDLKHQVSTRYVQD